MSLIKGPFTIKWGDNVITDVEEVNPELEINSDEYETIQGNTYEVEGAYKASATLVLLASDIASLAVLLPQHFVANGEILSTGETVDNATGAIDIVPGQCDESAVYNNFDIIACGTNAQIARIVNARTKVDSVDIDGKVAKVTIKIIGEPAADQASMQFFREGTISVVS